ncbi:MAG: histidine kinase [Burkholderiales bacterium]|nr:histidine kinase [Burkholderiales bacterium]
MTEPQDVTALAAALAARERELQQANERLRLILDNAPVFIYLVDERGRFLSVNRGWLEQIGIDSSSVIGRALGEVFPPAVAAQFAQNNACVLRADGPLEFEETQAGRTYLSVKVPVRDAAGRAFAVCGMSVDITDRKRSEAALRESEDRFRSFTDSLPLIVWVHDADGAQEFVNRTFCEFFGVSREEMRAGRWQMLMHPEDGEAYSAAFFEAVRDRRPFHGEVRVRRHDGEWRWIESWGRPRFSPSGEFLGFVGTSADITERKRAERKVRESEAALREADRKKDEFLAVLAHELRNPLAPIRNAVHIMRAPGMGQAELAEARDIIERQVKQLVRLVDDLLDISRITVGRMALQQAVLDLRAVADDALLMSGPLLDEAEHDVTVHLPPQPVWVRGDGVRLAQVISNLLNNAARYTPRGGSVSLRVTEEGADALVLVEDTGVGLSPGVLERIFEPFVQAEGGASRAAGGLGIGLALSRSLTQLHGGTIKATSPGPGHGSCFVVRLPSAQQERPRAVAPKAAPAASGRPSRLLIVDDNQDSARSQAKMLRLLGHEVEVAFEGGEALRQVAAFRPDVVLLDLGLPGIDGYEVARRIRAMPEGREVLLVAQTGWGQDEDRRRTAAAGFDAHLVKPVELDALLRLLDERASSRVARPA